MPYIGIIDENEVTGKVREIYGRIRASRGKVSNIMKVKSLNQDVMKDHLNLYLSIMFGRSGLSREEREMVAVIVSSMNNCRCCLIHHSESLNHYWKNKKEGRKD